MESGAAAVYCCSVLMSLLLSRPSLSEVRLHSSGLLDLNLLATMLWTQVQTQQAVTASDASVIFFYTQHGSSTYCRNTCSRTLLRCLQRASLAGRLERLVPRCIPVLRSLQHADRHVGRECGRPGTSRKHLLLLREVVTSADCSGAVQDPGELHSSRELALPQRRAGATRTAQQPGERYSSK